MLRLVVGRSPSDLVADSTSPGMPKRSWCAGSRSWGGTVSFCEACRLSSQKERARERRNFSSRQHHQPTTPSLATKTKLCFQPKEGSPPGLSYAILIVIPTTRTDFTNQQITIAHEILHVVSSQDNRSPTATQLTERKKNGDDRAFLRFPVFSAPPRRS